VTHVSILIPHATMTDKGETGTKSGDTAALRRRSQFS
jgi:hypothetical protein